MTAPPAARGPAFEVLTVGLFVLLMVNPVRDTDAFWQVRLGELAVTGGGFPATEPFLAGLEGRPLENFYWLSQAAFGAARLAGGWRLVQAVDAAAWLGGFWVVARSVLPGARSVVGQVLPLLLAFTAAGLFANVRAQSFAVLGFGLLVVLLRSRVRPAWAVGLGATLLVAWQNFHPSVAVAAVLLGSAAAAGWVGYLRGTDRPPWAATALLAACPAAAVAQPMGADLFRVALYNAEISNLLGIGEWLPAWDPGNRTLAAPFWAVLAVTGWLAATRRAARPPLVELVPAVVFTVATLASFRFVLFWAAVMIPVWARYLADGPPAEPARGSWRNLLAAAVAAVVGAGVLVVARPSQFASYIPLDGVAELRARGVRGTVFCHFMWGGVVADAGHPDVRVTHDGRYFLRTRDEWADYFAATGGHAPVADLEARYRPAAFFLRPGGEEPLMDRLRADPGWVEVYADPNCVLFVPREGRPGPPAAVR